MPDADSARMADADRMADVRRWSMLKDLLATYTRHSRQPNCNEDKQRREQNEDQDDSSSDSDSCYMEIDEVQDKLVSQQPR